MRDPSAWIQTFTGRQFWPMDPRPEEICIEDIAHALSMQCRFSGHTLRHYSVAEHCIRVSEIVEGKELQLKALLHDASEAYLVDIPSPLKRLPAFALYREAESRLEKMIFRKFGLSEEMPEEVKHADLVLLATEKLNLMGKEPAPWLPLPPPLLESFWRKADVHGAFLRRFYDLKSSIL